MESVSGDILVTDILRVLVKWLVKDWDFEFAKDWDLEFGDSFRCGDNGGSDFVDVREECAVVVDEEEDPPVTEADTPRS